MFFQHNQDQLNQQRQEFWATRIDGHSIIWQALHSAADAMLANDIALANAILEVMR